MTAKYERRIKHPVGKKDGKQSTLPIKDDRLLKRVMDYLWNQYLLAKTPIKKYLTYRNYMLFLIGFNTAFRAEDLLQLRVKDVIKGYVNIKELKTGKVQNYRMNKQLHDEIITYVNTFGLENYLFMGQKKKSTTNGVTRDVIYPITRQNCDESIFPSVKAACGINFKFALHSLRKTFGYMYIYHGGSMLTLQKMYMHESLEITLRYVMWDEQDIEKTRNGIFIGGTRKK